MPREPYPLECIWPAVKSGGGGYFSGFEPDPLVPVKRNVNAKADKTF